MKEHLTESVDKVMKPMINSMFREMTILGFLSMVTFIITQFNFVSMLSSKLFGESDFLLEIFELVHYSLFFVMIFFITQVLISAREAMMTEALWLKMNKQSKCDEFAKEIVKKMKDTGFSCEHNIVDDIIFKKTGKLTIFNRGWSSEVTLEDQLSFYALREEFIKDRSSTTFLPESEDSRLPADFNYGRYLGLCLGKILSRIVDVKHETWYFFVVSTLLFYFIGAFTNNTEVIAFSWVFLAYLFLTVERLFNLRLNNIINAFISLEGTHLLELLKEEGIVKSVKSNEGTSLLEDQSNGCCLVEKMYLPRWCHIDLDNYKENRSLIMKLVKGEPKPNRKYLIYMFEEYGPQTYFIILQISLVYLGIYCALLFVHFFPVVKEEYSTIVFLLYVSIALFPVFAMMANKKHLLITLTQCCSIGSHRWLQVISNVTRESKTKDLVHTLVVLYKWHRLATGVAIPTERGPHYSETINKLDLNQVLRIFDQFDINDDGSLQVEEIKHIMTQVGLKLNSKSLGVMLSVLDTNENGEVSKEEFLQWYADNMVNDSLTTHQRAHFLFELFDKDRSGIITIGEFKEQIDAMSIAFSVDEIGELVQELDEDGDGMVSHEEFLYLLKKYYPGAGD